MIHHILGFDMIDQKEARKKKFIDDAYLHL